MTADGRYLDLTIDQLLDELAAPDPVPGAGFAAALSVSMGAAIVTMAARLSREWLDGRGSAAQAETLRKRIMELASRNAEAYAEALAALEGRQERYRTRDETMADACEPRPFRSPAVRSLPKSESSYSTATFGLASLAIERP